MNYLYTFNYVQKQQTCKLMLIYAPTSTTHTSYGVLDSFDYD